MKRSLGVLCVTLPLLVTACREPPSGPALPRPDLSGFDPRVQAEIAAAQETAERLRAEGSQPGPLAEAYGRLGMLFHAYSLFEAAIPFYREAIGLDPDNATWHYYLGRAAWKAGDLDTALEALEWVARAEPDNPVSLLALAECELASGRIEASREHFRQALDLAPSGAAHYGLGRAARAAGRVEEAIAEFRAALDVEPRANVVHYALGLAYRDLGDSVRARRELAQRGPVDPVVIDPRLQALRRLATGAAAALERADAAQQEGDLELALAETRRALEANGRDAAARRNLAHLLTLTRDLDAAEPEARAATDLDPLDPRGHLLLARILRLTGRSEEALESLERAVELDPEDRVILRERAECLWDLERPRAAAQAYRELVELEPREVRFRVLEAQALAAAGQDREALERLEAAHTELPASGDIAQALARLLATSPDSTVRDGERSLALAVATWKAQPSLVHGETVAMALAELGRFSDAVSWQRDLLREARQQGAPEVAVAAAAARLNLYAAGEPYRRPRAGASHSAPPRYSQK